MQAMMTVGVGAVSSVLSWSAVGLIQRHCACSGHRQLHHTHRGRISRFGGLALIGPFLAVTAFGLLYDPELRARALGSGTILGTCVAMFLLGFVDDVRPLGAKSKLVGQILIASAAYAGGIQIAVLHEPVTGIELRLAEWSWAATVGWLVAFTNLINLIDGVDGLAAGISLLVLSLLVGIGLQLDHPLLLICAVCMAGAVLGLLYHNLPPATIYLGDGGAYLLGFMIGLLSILSSQNGSVAGGLLAPLFALTFPIVDVILAILRRQLHGLPVFRADQRHLHHRLAECGLSRTQMVLLLQGGSLVFLLVAYGVWFSDGRWTLIALVVVGLILLAAAGAFPFSRPWFDLRTVWRESRALRRHTRYALALGKWFRLDAERCGSTFSLWADLGFVASRLGFAKVSLWGADGPRHWEAGIGRSDDRQAHRRRLKLPGGAVLEFTAPLERLRAPEFDLLTELAAEIWCTGLERWQKAHPRDLSPRLRADLHRNGVLSVARRRQKEANGSRSGRASAPVFHPASLFKPIDPGQGQQSSAMKALDIREE